MSLKSSSPVSLILLEEGLTTVTPGQRTSLAVGVPGPIMEHSLALANLCTLVVRTVVTAGGAVASKVSEMRRYLRARQPACSAATPRRGCHEPVDGIALILLEAVRLDAGEFVLVLLHRGGGSHRYFDELARRILVVSVYLVDEESGWEEDGKCRGWRRSTTSCLRNAPHSSRGTDVCLIGAHLSPIDSLGGPKSALHVPLHESTWLLLP